MSDTTTRYSAGITITTEKYWTFLTLTRHTYLNTKAEMDFKNTVEPH